MKKFKFSLARMLDYKEQVLDKEKSALNQLRANKNALDKRIETMEHGYEEVGEQLTEKTSQGITVQELKAYRFQMDNIRMQLKSLRNEQRLMAVAIENQLKVVVAATQEVSGLDKLQEKQYKEYQYGVAKAEEQVIAEFVSNQLIRQKQGAVSVSAR